MAPSTALQALAVVTAAVALQQVSSRRSQRLAAAKVKAAADAQQQQKEKQQASEADKREEAFVVEIEYCTGCRWMLRAAWLGQELITTFQNELHAVKLTPNSNTGGVFQVYVYDENTCDLRVGSSDEKELLWSRKAVGRFPESKELKQIVRDFISPDKGLGHSDKK
ncbi:Selenoprotein w-related family [Globisporangium polare]